MKYGFACHLLDNNGDKLFPLRTLRMGAFLEKPDIHILEEIAVFNIAQTIKTVRYISKQDSIKRMFRISSEILPLYTVPQVRLMYNEFQARLAVGFKKIGIIAREADIRLSFHPGQYTVLGSHNPDVISASIRDIEYHTTCAYLMGYGRFFQDFKINVHANGKGGYSQVKKSLSKLSPEALLMITLENDERTRLSDMIEANFRVPIVLDLHHYWVYKGKYIRADSDSVKYIIDTWCTRRPVMHVSMSKIIEDGNLEISSKMKLRAHSDYLFDEEFIKRVHKFDETFDIMCECKAKNLARDKVLKYLKLCD